MARTRATSGNLPPIAVPAYSIREVADFLQLPWGTVRNWSVGMHYKNTAGERRRFQPVILTADPKTPMLSFENLVEVHVLSSLRRDHRVLLGAVRKAVLYLRRETGSQHPLAERDMLTDGTDVFVERYGGLVNVSQAGQQAMREMVQKYLTRIDRNRAGQSIRLFPLTRTGVDVERAPKTVAIDPSFRFGQPFVVDCGVETRVIAGRHKAGDSVANLARDFDVSEDAIEEAIRYQLRAA